MKSLRYSYLINKAFLNVLVSSLLATMATQLSTSIGVAIAGNYVSPDAVSVINLTIPLVTFINAIYMLFGIGASYRISRLLGNSDYEGVKSAFSSSVVIVVILGLVISTLLFVFHTTIAYVLTSDVRLLGMMTGYLSVFALQPIFFLLTLHFSACVKSIGNAQLIPKVTLVGAILQIITAFVFVVIWGMGIKGIAFSACLSLAVQSFTYFWKGIKGAGLLNRFTFHFRLGLEIKENIKLSLPLFISLVVMGSVLYAINNIVATSLGTDGLNIVSVCMQLMLLTTMLMSGINSAMMPIGNMMMGEGDIDGVRMLNVSVIKTILVIFVSLSILTFIFPTTILRIFGLDQGGIDNGGIYAMRVVAIFIPLMTLSMMRMTSLMILSYNKLASLSAALRTILMLVCMIPIARIAPQHIWWAFPASVIISESFISFLSYRIHKHNPDLNPLTLIPKTPDSNVWSTSLSYDMQSLSTILCEAEDFMKNSQVESSLISKFVLTIDELASNIIKFAGKGKGNQKFDLLIRVMEGKIIASLKDDGIPFNPIRKEEGNALKTDILIDIVNQNIGLRIVNNIGLHLEHRYMYGQNIITIQQK